MTIKKKTLKLGYTVEKEGKQFLKSYSYPIANNIEQEVAKELGESLATLLKEDIEEYSLAITETL